MLHVNIDGHSSPSQKCRMTVVGWEEPRCREARTRIPAKQQTSSIGIIQPFGHPHGRLQPQRDDELLRQHVGGTSVCATCVDGRA